jgi:uncharacterized damage-inducible protein DinB/aspartate 1-decarboxylase
MKQFIAAKIHGIVATDRSVDYHGSVGICAQLMAAAGIDPYEQVQVVNLRTGDRWITYAIADRPGTFALNGGSARLGEVGDRCLVMTYQVSDRPLPARVVFCDAQNRISGEECYPIGETLGHPHRARGDRPSLPLMPPVAAPLDTDSGRCTDLDAVASETDRLDGNRPDGDRLDGDRLDGDRLDGDRPDRNRLDHNRPDRNRLDHNRPDRNWYVAMADYNAWMNEQAYAVCAQIPDAERRRDRGAFFGSIHGTLNHLLFGDLAWMGRFLGRSLTDRHIGDELYADFAALHQARLDMDAQIGDWVRSLTPAWLAQPITYVSPAYQRTRVLPAWLLVTHMFNHQTHHRGQLSTLLTQLGYDLGITDLPWMPSLALQERPNPNPNLDFG